MTERLSLPHQAKPVWQEWLSQQPWHLFVTVTNKHLTTPEAMRHRVCWHLNQVSDAIYGRRVTRQRNPIEYVLGLERHKSGLPHMHCLWRFPTVPLKIPQERFSLAYWQDYLSKWGHVRLDPPRSQEHATDYVVKYVTKDGELYVSRSLQTPLAVL